MSVNEGLGYRGPFIVMILFLLIVMAGIVLVNGKMAGGRETSGAFSAELWLQ